MIDNFEEGDCAGKMEVLSLNFCEIHDGDNIEGYILAGGNNKKIVAYSIRTGLMRA